MQTDLNKLLTLNADEALSALQTSWKGLSKAEAALRLKTYGQNTIKATAYRSLVLEALSHSMNPLVAILIIAAIISAFAGNLASALIIIVVITVSIVLDYFQTHRSLLAAKKLQSQVAIRAEGLREGQEIDLLCSDLVPGDLIHLCAGDLVPADCLLLSSRDLHVQQAALTGESLPVEKESIPLNNAPQNLAEASNAVFSGSSIVSGNATALVVSTGKETLFGKIAESLSQSSPQTEFEKGIVRFGLFIMKTVIFLVFFVFIVNIYLKHPVLESLLFAIALAVGLTPEFLPMITTVTLATGAIRMSKQKVIVKNLAAIQNFGSIDILCSDKTGTLTLGEMTLEQYIDLDGKKSEQVLLLAYVNSLFSTNIKNPLDKALLNKAGINPLDAAILRHDHPSIRAYSKVDEIPFDFERRSASIVVNHQDRHLLITKGAPESLITRCTHIEQGKELIPLNNILLARYREQFYQLSQQGYRVLAVAYRQLPKQKSYSKNDEKELVLTGFLAFADPALDDAAEMIAELKKAGVDIKILTGDNDLVTHYICTQVGLATQSIILGSELDSIPDQALGVLAERTQVFARISPQQKLRIISALRSRGHIVGYIGDGINDAPSLHNADVGISVFGAVDVAREAADIILLERNLRVLLNGIIEGRKSFGNIMKYLMMGTSSNFGNMLSMAIAAPFLPFLPMKPTQILLNNLLYDISQITIPTDNVDVSFVQKPKHWNIDIIKRFMFYIGPISSIFDFMTFFVMLYFFKASESLFQTGWFVESLATQTLVIFVIRTVKNPFKSRPSIALTLSVISVVIFSLLLPFSPLATTLGFVPLPLAFFVYLIAATLSYLFLVEIIKNKLMWQWLARTN